VSRLELLLDPWVVLVARLRALERRCNQPVVAVAVAGGIRRLAMKWPSAEPQRGMGGLAAPAARAALDSARARVAQVKTDKSARQVLVDEAGAVVAVVVEAVSGARPLAGQVVLVGMAGKALTDFC